MSSNSETLSAAREAIDRSNYDEAIQILGNGSLIVTSEAQYLLAYALLHRVSETKDKGIILQLLQDSATHGDPDALHLLGDLYFPDFPYQIIDSARKSESLAIGYYRTAAEVYRVRVEQGDPRAMHMIACYMMMEFIPRENKQIEELLITACKLGNWPSCLQLQAMGMSEVELNSLIQSEAADSSFKSTFCNE